MIEIVKLKGKKVRCDVCQKTIKTETFHWIVIHKSTYEDRFIQGCASADKDLEVCNDCIKDLNFKRYEQ